MKKPILLRCVLLILPLFFLWSGFKFERNNYPNDPEYIYLMNALCINDGQSVGHVDNPGTTLIQLSAAVISVKHLFSRAENETAIEQVLTKPGLFIESIRKVMVLMNTIILVILGLIVFTKTGSIWDAIFSQLLTEISAFVLELTWASLSTEPLLFFITVIYSILSIVYYHDENKKNWKYVFLFALITGAGLGTKATFIPLVVFPVIILPSVKRKIYYLLGVALSFVLFTIPAIPEYDRMYFWFRDMITHSGIYGHGEKKVIDFETYLPAIKKILTSNPLLTITLSITTIALIAGIFFKKKQNLKWDLKFLTGLLVVFVFGTLLVAKHYGGNHYLFPVLLVSGISFYFVINMVFRFFQSKKTHSFLMSAVVIALVLFIGWNHPKKLIISSQQYKAASKEIGEANLWVEKNFGNYTRINYYIYSINKFTGLKFGNDFAMGKMLPQLQKMYPHTYFYELSSDTYLNWNTQTSLQNIVEKHGNKILLMNAPNDTSQITEMEKRGFPLKQIYNGQAQNIYVLDTVKYTQPAKQIFNKVGTAILFDADHYSDDRKYFFGNNKEIFGPVNALSTEEARSGQNSIKLKKSNPFAVKYILTDLKAGDRFQIDVWRKTKGVNGYLVIAAEKPETFYMAQNEVLEYEENGWGLLRVIVDIKPETEGETLKIYLWNPRSSAAYFDDLSIQKFSAVSK